MKKIFLPSSKSITNRVLLLAALGDKPMELRQVLDCDDTRYMRGALKSFGVQFEHKGQGRVRVIPPKTFAAPQEEVFVGNAGTAARFLSALSLLSPGSFTLIGDERMRSRPQADLQKALMDLGVSVKSLDQSGFLPTHFSFSGAKMPSSVSLSGQVSSQFLSALLLVAAKLENGLEIEIEGVIPSWPYIEMTLALLKSWGVVYTVTGQQKITIKPGLKSPQSYQIPADMSAASYPMAWSLLSGHPIEIANFGQQTLQGDEGFLQVVEQMGGTIERDGDQCQIWPGDKLNSIGDWDWSAMPDVSMTGMVLAACHDSTVRFTGLESLRVKECDRIMAMSQLNKFGVGFEIAGDAVTITGNSALTTVNSPTLINSYDDHRVAMCFGLLRATQSLEFDITTPECVGKTWPDFWTQLADWQYQLRPVSAVILVRESPGSLDPGLIEYLIVKKPRRENAWQFPQGGVDPGETGLQAAKRELKEECGAELVVKFKGEKPVGDYKYLFPKGFKRHQPNIRGAKVEFFMADYLSGAVAVDGQEIIDYAWVTTDRFSEYFSPDYLAVVQDLV